MIKLHAILFAPPAVPVLSKLYLGLHAIPVVGVVAIRTLCVISQQHEHSFLGLLESPHMSGRHESEIQIEEVQTPLEPKVKKQRTQSVHTAQPTGLAKNSIQLARNSAAAQTLELHCLLES